MSTIPLKTINPSIKTVLININKFAFNYIKLFTFSCLICAVNLEFAQKLLRKAKFARGFWNCNSLLQTPKVAQTLSSTIRTGLCTVTMFTCYLIEVVITHSTIRTTTGHLFDTIKSRINGV